jgi:hypothetical protein
MKELLVSCKCDKKQVNMTIDGGDDSHGCAGRRCGSGMAACHEIRPDARHNLCIPERSIFIQIVEITEDSDVLAGDLRLTRFDTHKTFSWLTKANSFLISVKTRFPDAYWSAGTWSGYIAQRILNSSKRGVVGFRPRTLYPEGKTMLPVSSA